MSRTVRRHMSSRSSAIILMCSPRQREAADALSGPSPLIRSSGCDLFLSWTGCTIPFVFRNRITSCILFAYSQPWLAARGPCA